MAEKKYLVLVGKRQEGKAAEVPPEKISKVVEDYPNKVLADVTADQLQELVHQGHKVQDLSDKTKIRVGMLAIDPTVPKEREEAVGPAEEEEAIETGYFFVQFIGPVKPEWLEELQKVNVAPLSYYHDFAYLVYGQPDNIKKLEALPIVRAIMPYSPRVKLSPETKSVLEGESITGETREFVISNSH